ncbi:hypothetical protein [uncultured Serinicoccus sp.]|uniref:hypothetical protein n=1 Tax=uncultured Serinicoccus sp. TaxID=735514 RepID=UPI00261CAF8C|nr:hypothetical protein [uncultured Serinicoccus sp.]
MPSQNFVHFFAVLLLILLVLLVIWVAQEIVSGSTDSSYAGVVSQPLVVAVSFASNPDIFGLHGIGGWNLFGATFVLGLASGLLSFPATLKFRDAMLSIVSAYMLYGLFSNRMQQGIEAAYVFVFVALCVALVYNLVRLSVRRVVRLGTAALATVEVIDFLVSPFGLSYWEYVSAHAGVLTTIAACCLGVGLVLRPTLVVGVGVFAVVAGNLFFNLLLWFANENGEMMGYPPDFTGWIALIGCLLGLGITSPVYYLSAR